jgi:hypothetical protein
MPPSSGDAPAAVDTSDRQSSNAKAHSNSTAAAAGDVTLSSEQRQKNEDAYTQMGHTSDVLCIAWYVHVVT